MTQQIGQKENHSKKQERAPRGSSIWRDFIGTINSNQTKVCMLYTVYAEMLPWNNFKNFKLDDGNSKNKNYFGQNGGHNYFYKCNNLLLKDHGFILNCSEFSSSLNIIFTFKICII